MAGKRKPWDHQDGETSEGFQAFAVYRDLGPDRSLTMAAPEAGYSRTQMKEFSRKYDWVVRARAWDRRVDQAKTRATLGEVEKMHARHVSLALKFQDLTGIELDRLIEKKERELEKGSKSGEQITSANDLAKVAERAVRIERLARGEVTERVETHFDLSKLSVRELLELKRLRAKMGTSEEEAGDADSDE